MTKFSEVAHLYKGCKVEYGFDGNEKIGELGGYVYPFGYQISTDSILVPYKNVAIELIKPILRPLSSMTEEEEAEYTSIIDGWNFGFRRNMIAGAESTKYLLSKHFDLFSLIPNGEAITNQ